MTDDIRKRYHNDPMFRALVRTLVDALNQHVVSIDDIRQASVLAVNIYALESPWPFFSSRD